MKKFHKLCSTENFEKVSSEGICHFDSTIRHSAKMCSKNKKSDETKEICNFITAVIVVLDRNHCN